MSTNTDSAPAVPPIYAVSTHKIATGDFRRFGVYRDPKEARAVADFLHELGCLVSLTIIDAAEIFDSV